MAKMTIFSQNDDGQILLPCPSLRFLFGGWRESKDQKGWELLQFVIFVILVKGVLVSSGSISSCSTVTKLYIT